MRAFCEAPGFQLQLSGCKYKVIIAADAGERKRSCVCFVVAGLEMLGCQDEVSLVVNLPVRGVPGCVRTGQLAGMETVGKGESVALCEL